MKKEDIAKELLVRLTQNYSTAYDSILFYLNMLEAQKDEEIKELREKLAVAVKALTEIVNTNTDVLDVARETIERINAIGGRTSE